MSERRESPVTQGATEVRSESVLGHEGYTGELEKALELDTASSIDGRAEFERRERALKESEEKFRMIFEHANDGIIYLDESCTIIDVNPRVEEMFGTKREDLVGKGFSEKGFVLPHLVPRILSELDRALGSGFGDLIEIEARRMDGSPIFLEASLRVIVREGGDRRLIALLRDVTGRNRVGVEMQRKSAELLAAHEEQQNLMNALEEQNRIICDSQLELAEALDRAVRSEEEVRDKNEQLLAMQENLREMNQHLEERVMQRTSEIASLLRQKESFINQLAHDLRSPLTPVVALLPMLRDRQSDPKSKEIAEMVIRNIDYMEDLVSSTIKLAKLNADVKFDLSPISIWATVDGVLKRGQYRFAESNVSVENRIDRGVMVSADRLRLAEVIENLATNAVKFMPGGGALVFDAQTSGEFAVISVRDTGIGITSEQMAHIFEEFWKADKSRHDLGSSGLGLAICQRIVEKHGGKIWAESEGTGKGTTFFFTLPLHATR